MCSFLLKICYKQFKITNFLLVMMLVATSSIAHAEEAINDKFKIALGGYTLVRNDTTMSLTEPTLGVGISIDPEDTLGLESKQTVLRLDGHYRFTKEHALTYSIYSLSSTGNKTLETEFEWLDEDGNTITIPVGANVDTSLGYEIFKLGYLWSFYHTDKIEVAFGAGLHLTRIAIGLRAEATGTDLNTKDTSTSLPLPVVSLGLIYNVTPKFSWHVRSELFALKFEEWDGIYTDTQMGVEYRAFKNVGLGIGLGSNSLKVTKETSEEKFIFDNRITGVLIYAAAYF